MKIIDKSNYKDVVYLSHPYGGKKIILTRLMNAKDC